MGTGLLESAYGDAPEVEFTERKIPCVREFPLPLNYKGHVLRTVYRADFICHDRILLELKAASGLSNVDLAQVGHYLALTGLTTGLLVNFARAPMQIRRFVHGAVEPVSPDSVDSAVRSAVS